VLDRVNRRDRFAMKKPLRSSARGASFHTKHASNANVVQVVLLDANSNLALIKIFMKLLFASATHSGQIRVRREQTRVTLKTP
jgi:hypothetical protein